MKKLIQYIRQSLSLKLSLMIILFSVTIFLVAVNLLYRRSCFFIHHESIGQTSHLLDNTVLRVSGLLNEAETASRNVEWILCLHLHPDTIYSLTRRVVELNPIIAGCTVTLEPDVIPHQSLYYKVHSVNKGDSVATSVESVYGFFEGNQYKMSRMLGRGAWMEPSEVKDGLSLSDIVISYCKPLYLSDGRFIGVLSVELSLQLLTDVITAEKPYSNSYFVLLGKEGNYLVHPDTTKLVKGNIVMSLDADGNSGMASLGYEMLLGKTGHLLMQVKGQQHTAFFQPVANTLWSMALICPESDILSGYAKMRYILFPLFFIGLLVLLGMSYHTVSYFIGPLHDLADHSRRIASGNFDEVMPSISRSDLVGQLQNNFSSMQRSLKEYVTRAQQVISETEQRNDELVQAKLQVDESRRKKAAFIQNMTHQVRTPLNIIYGFSQVLRDNSKEMTEEEVKNIVGVIQRNCVTLSRMIYMLIDSAKLDHEKRLSLDEIVGCNEIAREVLDDVHRQFPDNPPIVFQTTVPDNLCIHTNHLYLFRSMRELLYNSEKHSSKTYFVLKVNETPDKVVYTFEDVGPGIPKEEREHIFELFSKGNDFTEGLGLGLPLTKEHAKNLGGDLILDTSYFFGCRFVLTLPKV